MSFKEKIDKILSDNHLQIDSVTALEDYVEAGRSSINNFYKENKEPGRKTLKKIKSLPGLNLEWYETGKGQVFLKNGTGVKESTDNSIMEDPEEVYRKLVEGNTEYVLIPRSVLQEKYRLVSLEQFQKDKEQMEKDKKESENQQRIIDKLLDQYDKVIARLTVLDPKLSGVQKSKQNS
jgi:hypothetical protein